MKRLALTAVAGLLFVVACQDMSTDPAPAVQGDQVAYDGHFAPANPPPPPIDSGAVGVADAAAEEGSTSNVIMRVSYMLNKPENNGWLKFNKDEFDNTTIDNSAGIKMSGGVYSGKGVIRILADNGTGFFIFDLAKMDLARTSFQECSAPTAPSLTDGGTAGSCFQVILSGNYYASTTATPKVTSLWLRPGKTTPDTCKSDVRGDCFISAGQ